MSHRTFLLSPASCAGRRAQLLLRDGADFPLARTLRDGGVPLGEVFAFLSGLYFRGKLAYATRFASPPSSAPGVLVITTTRGLLDPETRVGREDLLEFARGNPDPANRRYAAALRRSAASADASWYGGATVVLLGSVATAKYVELLLEVFGERLRIPAAFVGRGDMSRGGLLLRCAAAEHELDYIRPQEAPRRGPRPPRLDADPAAPRAARLEVGPEPA